MIPLACSIRLSLCDWQVTWATRTSGAVDCHTASPRINRRYLHPPIVIEPILKPGHSWLLAGLAMLQSLLTRPRHCLNRPDLPDLVSGYGRFLTRPDLASQGSGRFHKAHLVSSSVGFCQASAWLCRSTRYWCQRFVLSAQVRCACRGSGTRGNARVRKRSVFFEKSLKWMIKLSKST